MLQFLYRRAAHLPLPLAHALGAAVGVLAWVVPNKFTRRTRFHIALCLPELGRWARERLVLRALLESGKALAELPVLWSGPAARVSRLVREVRGAEDLDRALAAGKGIVGASPHLGSWEMAGLDYSRRHRLVSMYRFQGNAWDDLMKRGRERFGAKLVPSDRSGVREQLEALRRGETIGVLPDQDPPEGSGAFAPFFGIAAHTPVLATRLARRTGAAVLYIFAERLGWGRGFVLHIVPAPAEVADPDDARACAALNRGLEDCIRRFPAQYWWSYARFRRRPPGEPSVYG
ncbi:MAG TPA: lysophospholipid acyltransferase family protein [Burkholderiales bacterium]|nr:lysophospholipid acyltransferase family protein [Burkholderiales bacterium]